MSPFTYPALKLIIERGGISKTTSKSTWGKFISQLESAGLDTALIREYLSRTEFKEDGSPMHEVIMSEDKSTSKDESELLATPWQQLKSKVTRRLGRSA
ncbi:hypothetical protein F5X99DRAFT_341269 [Biscogniauxia marginata]|nr:hypothetical protein F5X99DRAFT_341269 [Biscogniauxia marginata]